MSVTRKQKLELTGVGKEDRTQLEPRVLLEDPEKSYHAKQRVTNHDMFDNHLFFCGNRRILKHYLLAKDGAIWINLDDTEAPQPAELTAR